MRRGAPEWERHRNLGALIMAIADEMADCEAVLVPNGVGIEWQPNHPNPIWTSAYLLAVDHLGETAHA